MAKESQRLDNLNFPRVIVDISSFLSELRQIERKSAHFNPNILSFLNITSDFEGVVCQLTSNHHANVLFLSGVNNKNCNGFILSCPASNFQVKHAYGIRVDISTK
jgi:hypothetical protein